MKAKFLRKYYDIENNPVLIYIYRGIEYEVVDRGWKGGEPLSWQHKNEQAHIDAFLDEKPKQDDKYRKSEPAQVGFDMFWEYVNS